MTEPTFPAIDGNELGTVTGVSIDLATVPYLLGAIKWLANIDLYEGDAEDVYETSQAFEQLIRRFSDMLEGDIEGLVMIPVGSINMFAGETVPDGWLMCDGAAYEIDDYADLYAAIGIVYGGGGTQFNVPDMKGRSPIGADPLGLNGNNRTISSVWGTENETLTVNQIPSHTHTQNAHTHTQNAHTHVQNSHSHVQDAHTHTQNAHTHTQQSHTHTQDSHNHTQNSHNHTQDSHNHTQNAHAHTTGGRNNGTIGANNRFLNGTTAGTTNELATTSDVAVNQAATATNQAATATNNGTVATNQSATAINNDTTAANNSTVATNQNATATNQNATATNQNATATNQVEGGGLSHNNIHPCLTVNYIIKY